MTEESTTSNTEELVSKCIAYANNGDASGVTTLTAELEKIFPTARDEWVLLDDLFRRLKKPAWAEIMAKRYLQADPQSIDALLAEVESLCRQPSKHSEASEKLYHVERMREPSIEWFMRLGQLAPRCRRGEDAVGYYRAILNLQPGHTDATIAVIHNYINVGNVKGAKRELKSLRGRAQGNLNCLLTVTRLAMRMDDKTFALSTILELLPLLVRGTDTDRAYAALVGFQTGGQRVTAHLVNSINVDKIADLQLLKSLFLAIEGFGFAEREHELIGRILTIAPNDLDFRDLGGQQRATRYGFLSLKPGALLQNSHKTPLKQRLRLLWG